MTAPRQILPGRSYLITRRCLLRHFFLRPCAAVNEVVAYVLALAAQRYGVQVHAYCVLSNHLHLVVTDPQARLPAFQQYLASFVARALNAHLGRWEFFWAPGSYSAVALGSPGDVVAKAAYTLANPVAAGLVKEGRLWPGLWSSPDSIGTTIRVQRPAGFFDEEGLLPESVDLELTVPAGFSSTQDFRDQLQAELRRQEQAARDRHPTFLGVVRVRAQSPFGRPEPDEPRRQLVPRVAALDKWKRIELLQRLKSFLTGYAEALDVWRAGPVDPIFPAGTYLMRVAHGVACAPA
ncbi:MAG: transposase [Anaeromyxobacter sp.]|nr:transposase [Anaeromyxobacter sp.]MBL0275141.1 transposase [Anaeromyxobacter sp.]